MIPIYLLFNNTFGWGDTFLPLFIPTFFFAQKTFAQGIKLTGSKE